MRAFACNHCGQLLFFENSHCLRCGTALGFVPEQLTLCALEPVGWDRYRTVDDGSSERARTERYKRCARAGIASCNWLLHGDDSEDVCVSCRLTHSAPVMQTDAAMRAFAQAEAAKRRLLYQLLDLHLPVVSRKEDPKHGLSFVFAFSSESQRVVTGHLNGVVTLDLLECDSAYREKLRHQFGEPYRTLLGHLRHEIGHYYWDVLIDGRRAHAPFRELFGDERADYREALKRNYEGGSRWSSRHVSAYAASHPWEDWAETFAHYLHIRDTLQTAANFGLRVSPSAQTVPPRGGKLAARAREEIAELDFDEVVAEWLPLTYAFNAANRSMGKDDLYPFVLAPEVIEKLSFVHDLVRFVDLQELHADEPSSHAQSDSVAQAAELAMDAMREPLVEADVERSGEREVQERAERDTDVDCLTQEPEQQERSDERDELREQVRRTTVDTAA
ncbi:MAG: hypothetical protein JWN48_2845 [Myxococcaceae bacterium]|nr:hypothetical protein [Myxococcaceae bacterium]